MMKRVLFIAHRMPYPPDKGDRVRAFHEIQALSDQFRITLASLVHSRSDYESAAPLRRWCENLILAPGGGRLGLLRGAIYLAGGRSVTEGYFHSSLLRKLLREEVEREAVDLVFAYCSSTLPYALEVPAGAHVMDLVDIDSEKWASYAAGASWPRRWLYRREARGVRSLEHRCVQQCDAVLLVSQAETQALDVKSDKILPLPNGVDAEYFTPRPPPAGSKRGLVFTGTMDYRPNVEGVCWFVREVWPRLRREAGDLTFTIVGRDPARPVQRLAAVPGVTVTGAVEDVRPYLAAAAVAVVPLHIARGIQNKMLEAMAMGRAVVASPEALEGIDAEAGKEVLSARSVEEWCQHVRQLLADEGRRRQFEQAARACVVAKYSWPARMAPLVALCRQLTQRTSGNAAC